MALPNLTKMNPDFRMRDRVSAAQVSHIFNEAQITAYRLGANAVLIAEALGRRTVIDESCASAVELLAETACNLWDVLSDAYSIFCLQNNVPEDCLRSIAYRRDRIEKHLEEHDKHMKAIRDTM